MVYELHKEKMVVLNLAVHTDYLRQGLGTILTDKLKSKLSTHRRTLIEFSIRESNSVGQMFFSANGFMATKVLREEYEDNGEDGYRMEYRLDGNYPLKRLRRPVLTVDTTNRIGDYLMRRK